MTESRPRAALTRRPAVVSDSSGLVWPATHVDTQLVTPEQRGSDLLFPAEDGRLRCEHFLTKAFQKVGSLIDLKHEFTPRGMRRTFNDLMRLAQVEALVTKSISGHLTERMREHYSTVSPAEQRESIGRVLRLVKCGENERHPTQGGGNGGVSTPPSGGPERSRAS